MGVVAHSVDNEFIESVRDRLINDGAGNDDEYIHEVFCATAKEKYSDLDAAAKKAVDDRVISIREKEYNTYKDCIAIIDEEFGVEITRNNIYNIMSRSGQDE